MLGLEVEPWVVLPALYFTFAFVGWTLKKIVFAWLKRLTSRTETKIDDILIGAATWPVSLMIFVWSLTLTMNVMGSALPPKWAHLALACSKAITLLAAVVFADRLLITAFKVGVDRFEALKMSQAFGGVLVHVVVFGLGGLMLLDSMGISITPIIASLGIGSLAVALALQPTLENVFAGFQILVDKPLQLGQFVRLESGEEGIVYQIGWRTTWVRQLSNNMVIIPNKQLVNARLLNFDYPSRDQAVLVQMGVHYASDLDRVEKVVIEVAREIQGRVEGAVREHLPFIRYNKFDASSINFTVILRGNQFVDGYLITHEFIKAVAARFTKENIVIPFPIVALNTTQERTSDVPVAGPAGA